MIAGTGAADGKLLVFGGQRIVAVMGLAEAASMSWFSDGGRQRQRAEVAHDCEEQQ